MRFTVRLNRTGIALWLIAVVASLTVAMSAQEPTSGDPLPSWNNGNAKSAVLQFVRDVTDKSGAKFVPPEERIAALDSDGTLMAEWPRHVDAIQMAFARQRVKELAKSNRVWEYEQPFKAILDNDNKELERRLRDIYNVLSLAQATHGSMTVDEFSSVVQGFLAKAKHSKFDVPLTQVVYPPMLELIALLQANQFKVFIVTGGGGDFVREYSEKVYGVPREQVIGSNPEYEFKRTPTGGDLVRRSNVASFNENDTKAENIQLHIGRRPIFVAGNSNSDLAMMEYAAGGKKPFLNLLVRHDDAEREFAYDEGAEKAIELAQARGWLFVSMRNDFKTVFSFPSKK
jgi:phosphoserine phosphatase